MVSDETRRDLAEALARAEEDRAPVPPLVEAVPGLDLVDAYEIQLANIRRRVEAGAVVKGHKVGLSSPAMQRMMGVAEPDYGHLLAEMFVHEATTVDTSALCAPRVEVEVAFVLGRELVGPGVTVADVVRATDVVMPAIEIIDSRISDWRIGIVDTIADNASSARVVLGGRATPPAGLDLRLLGALLTKNGEVVESGAAGAVLGNPAVAVAWLANTVAAFGVHLEAGHVILPGSCTRAVDVAAGDVVVAEFDRLGSVSVNFG